MPVVLHLSMAVFFEIQISVAISLLKNKRPIRSYSTRSGRLTDSQRKAIDKYWKDNVIPYRGELLDLGSIFSNQRPITLEIGFGMGASLTEMAQKDIGSNFLGIEVHKPGIGKTLNEIHLLNVKNLKLMCHDAIEVVTHSLVDQSLDRVLIFFPDPWPKKRHNKRRLIQTDFMTLIARKLKPNGRLHLATDWKPYAAHMMNVLEALSEFNNAIAPHHFWGQPDRPETKFEKRGKNLGHGVWDLLYKKNN